MVYEPPTSLEQRLQAGCSGKPVQARPRLLDHKALVVAACLEQELHEQANVWARQHQEGHDCRPHGGAAVCSGHNCRLAGMMVVVDGQMLAFLEPKHAGTLQSVLRGFCTSLCRTGMMVALYVPNDRGVRQGM